MEECRKISKKEVTEGPENRAVKARVLRTPSSRGGPRNRKNKGVSKGEKSQCGSSKNAGPAVYRLATEWRFAVGAKNFEIWV